MRTEPSGHALSVITAWAGTWLFVVAPSPSWPLEPRPQQEAAALPVAQAKLAPALSVRVLPFRLPVTATGAVWLAVPLLPSA